MGTWGKEPSQIWKETPFTFGLILFCKCAKKV